MTEEYAQYEVLQVPMEVPPEKEDQVMKELGLKIVDNFMRYGCVCIRNAQLSMYVDDAWKACRDFHSMPLSKKYECHHKKHDDEHGGYFGIGEEPPYEEGTVSHLEDFSVNIRDLRWDDAVWPTSIPEFKPNVLRFISRMKTVGDVVHKALQSGLGLR